MFKVMVFDFAIVHNVQISVSILQGVYLFGSPNDSFDEASNLVTFSNCER